MKKITNTIKHLSLILGILLALSYSNTLSAQTEEEYYEVEEEEESFFSEGINGSRFESNLSSDYETAKPDYNYKRHQNQSNENAFGNSVATPTYKELDIEVQRKYTGNNLTTIGGSGGGAGGANANNTAQSYVPGVGNVIPPGGVTPPLKDGNPGSYVPDNGGDPDAPIDGGVGLLIAAGIGYGLKKKLKKYKS
jgi:hypothetical protein